MTTNEDLLFVELALKRELVTQEQVDEILAVQKKLEEMGLTESVASLMVRKEVIKSSDAEAVRAKVSPKGGRQQIKGYRLIERLGRGGMGSVYKAVQISMGRTVALKILKPSLAQDDQSTSRLRREAQLVGGLRHKNIVQGLDFGVSNGFHYFAMEYVEGESVKELIERSGPMKEADALSYVTQLAEALGHAHEEGVVHRDVKPGNILIAKDGSAMLADYGLAKGPLEDVELTRSGVTVGTPQYISPEQARGPSDVDIRTDIYSLGATLYHMLTGRPPYEGETLAHLIQQVLYEPYAPVRSLRRDVSMNMAFLVDRMMARKPAHRYQSPKELLRDLAAIKDGKSIVPSGWAGSFEVYHQSRRLKRAVIATVVVLVLGMGGAVTYVLHSRSVEQQKFEEHAAEFYALIVANAEPTNLDAVIRKLDEFRSDGEYAGSLVSAEAAKRQDYYRKQQKFILGASDAGQKIGKLADAGEFAEAKRMARRFLETMEEEEGEGADYARKQIEKTEENLDVRRDSYVEKKVKDARRELAEEDPQVALDKLSDVVDNLFSKAYVEGEQTDALQPGDELRRNLRIANTGTERYLGEARKESKTGDYGKALSILKQDERRFYADEPLTAALDRIEPGWRTSLQGGFEDIRRQITSANQVEWDATQATARTAVEQQKTYAGSIDTLSKLADRSIPDIAVEIREMMESLHEELSDLSTAAATEWGQALPRFFKFMGDRNWTAAQNELNGLKDKVLTHEPNLYDAAWKGAQETLSLSITVEQTALAGLQGKKEAELTFGTIRERLYDITVTERTIQFAREPGGDRNSRHIRELSVDDLLTRFGFEEADILIGFVRAVLHLGEVQRMTDLGDAVREIDRIEGWMGKARDFSTIGPFAENSLSYVRTVQADLERRLQSDEKAAELLYSEAIDAYQLNNWQEAYDKLNLLLENRKLRESKWVQEHILTIKKFLEEVKTKLPGARLGNYFKTRSVHVSGKSINPRHYVVALSFDFKDQAELSHWRFTEGRVGLVEEEMPLAGPNFEDAMSREQLVAFLPPENLPEDGLKRHPLRLESPFLYSRDMSIRFRARWDEPVALIVSLCGTNLVVLSDNGRRENGRGVHIWQSVDLTRPDRAVPPVLRKTYLNLNPQVLEGDAKNHRYFQFEEKRWYRIGFEKTDRRATLLVNGRNVFEKEVRPRGAKGREIAILTYSPCELDEVRIEGTVDPEWYNRRAK